MMRGLKYSVFIAIISLSVSSQAVIPYRDSIQIKAAPLSHADEARHAFQKAVKSIEAGRTKHALKELQDILDYHPHFVSARLLLARQLVSQQQPQQAESLVKQGLLLKAGEPHLAKYLASLYQHKGEYKAALAVLQQVADTYHFDGEYNGLMGLCYLKIGLFPQASMHYTRLVRQQPKNAKAWLGLAASAQALGNTGQALKGYYQVAQIAQLDPELLQYVNSQIHDLSSPRLAE